MDQSSKKEMFDINDTVVDGNESVQNGFQFMKSLSHYESPVPHPYCDGPSDNHSVVVRSRQRWVCHGTLVFVYSVMLFYTALAIFLWAITFPPKVPVLVARIIVLALLSTSVVTVAMFHNRHRLSNGTYDVCSSQWHAKLSP